MICNICNDVVAFTGMKNLSLNVELLLEWDVWGRLSDVVGTFELIRFTMTRVYPDNYMEGNITFPSHYGTA